MVDDGNRNGMTAGEDAPAPREQRWMSKKEAVGRLLEISGRRDLGVEDVIAIQTAVRSLCKRIFDKERWLKRRHAPEAVAVDPRLGDGRAPHAAGGAGGYRGRTAGALEQR